MNEETKLKMSESRKGVAKSEEHKEAIRNSHLGRTHEWQDKINKNPEKIEKTAETHRGMKRSEESKQRISEAKSGKVLGENHRNFNGYFHTPYGKFCAATALEKQIGVKYWKIVNRCKQNDKIVNEKDITTDPNLSQTDVGKTWKECGWWFEPVEKTNI